MIRINVSLDASDHICQSRVTCHVSLGGVLALVAGLHLVLELLHLQRHLVQLVPGQGNVLLVKSYKYFFETIIFFF